MWRKRIMATVAASLALAATAASMAQARDDDMRGEERRADWQVERSAEAQLAVPRRADGTIDVQALVNDVDDLVARGVREIQFRDATLTQDEVRSLVLRIDGNLLGDLAAQLPNDGIQRQVTLRGAVDLRVQRQANGELRARIDDLFVGSPTEAQRAEFTQQLAERYGFDRLRIRGVDAEGNRIRVEFRADGGIVRNEARAGHREAGEDRADHRKDKDRGEDQAKRGERRDGREDSADRRENRREDRAERREDRGERAERHGKAERPERHAKFERHERVRVERPERIERARAERPERPDRSGRH